MHRMHHGNLKQQITLKGSNCLLFLATLINELVHILHGMKRLENLIELLFPTTFILACLL